MQLRKEHAPIEEIFADDAKKLRQATVHKSYIKVNLSIEEGEKLGNKPVERYGELVLTRGKGALAALARDLKEFFIITK